MESVKRGFVELQKSVNDAASGNIKAYDSFTRLGVSVEGLKKLSPDEQFKVIAEALSKVDDATERSTLGFEILGKSFTELTPMMEQGVAGLNAAAIEAAQIGQVLSKEDNANVKQMGENWEWLTNTVMGAFNTMAASIAPIFNEIVGYIKGWVLESTNFRDAIMLVFDILATGAVVIAKIIDGINAFIKIGSAGFSALAGVIFAFIEGTLKGINWLAQRWIDSINMMIAAWNKLPFTKKIAPLEFKLLDGAIKEIESLREGSFAAMSEFGNKAGNAWSNGFAAQAEAVIDKIHDKLASVGSAAMNEVKNTVTTSTTNTQTAGANKPTDAEKQMSVEYQLDQFFGDYDKKAKKIAEENAKLRESVMGNLITPYQQLQLELANVDYALSKHVITQQEAAQASTLLKGEYLLNFTEMGKAVGSFVTNFSEGFAELLTSGENFSQGLKNLFKNMLADIVKQWIAAMIKMMIAKLMVSIGGAIGGGFGGAISSMGTALGGKASGGSVEGGVPTYVGERGKEVFVPSTSGTIIPNGKLGNFMNPAPDVNYNIYAYDTDMVERVIEKNRPRLAQDALMMWSAARSRRRIS